jgi:hypothetical protein
MVPQEVANVTLSRTICAGEHSPDLTSGERDISSCQNEFSSTEPDSLTRSTANDRKSTIQGEYERRLGVKG